MSFNVLIKLIVQKQGKPKTYIRVGNKFHPTIMKKIISGSVKKILNKTEQKKIEGGICKSNGEGPSYPIWCTVNGVHKKVCFFFCDNY